MPWDLFHRVFGSTVHGFATAAFAEESVVSLPATINQNRHRDDGYESLRFPGGFVQLWKTTDHRTLSHCLAIVESKSPPPKILPPQLLYRPDRLRMLGGLSNLKTLQSS